MIRSMGTFAFLLGLSGCVTSPHQPLMKEGRFDGELFERGERVYSCRQLGGTDEFLIMNNQGETAKVRFLGMSFVGLYEVNDLERDYWFGSLPDSRFRYLVSLETDGNAYLYDFSKAESHDEEIEPARELRCYWQRHYG